MAPVGTASTFGQRFLYSLAHQRSRGRAITDSELARRLGFAGSSEITGYKKRDLAPPAPNVLIIAKICGVDPGWLAFGPDSHAPEPPDFATWLAAQTAPVPDIVDPIISPALIKALPQETDETDPDDAAQAAEEATVSRPRRRPRPRP